MSNLIYDKTHYALISKNVLEEGKIGFVFRIKNNISSDSGWRVFLDRFDESVDFFKVTLSQLRKWESSTVEWYEGKPYTVAEKISSGWVAQSRKDKKFDAIPDSIKQLKLDFNSFDVYNGETIYNKQLLDEVYDPKNIGVGFFMSTTKLALVPYDSKNKS